MQILKYSKGGNIDLQDHKKSESDQKRIFLYDFISFRLRNNNTISK